MADSADKPIKGGKFTDVARPKLITQAGLRAIIEELEERNLSVEGGPFQLALRLQKELIQEDLFADKAKTRQEQHKEEKRTKLLQKLTDKYGLKMWKNFGNEEHVRYVETYTNTQYKRKDHGMRIKRTVTPKIRTGENGTATADGSASTSSLGSSKRVTESECALCERIFMSEHLTGRVTLRSVWKKREQFPFKVEMPRILKNNWTKLYSQVALCSFCEQMFLLPMTETTVPFPKLKQSNFIYSAPRVMRSVGFGISAVQRPGLWGNESKEVDQTTLHSPRQRPRPSSAVERTVNPILSTPSLSDSFTHTKPRRPSTSVRKTRPPASPRGFGISSPRLLPHNPKEERLKSFMAARYAPNFNPFALKEDGISVAKPTKDADNPVSQSKEEILNNAYKKRSSSRKKMKGSKKGKRLSRPQKEWTLHGNFTF